MVAKVNSGKSKYKSPKKEKDKKKQHIVVNLLHPDGKTQYGWSFNNFYDAKEHLKNLSNRKGAPTVIGNVEFSKSFSNQTKKLIPDSKLGQNLWVIRIDSLMTDVESCFPMEPLEKRLYVEYYLKICFKTQIRATKGVRAYS